MSVICDERPGQYKDREPNPTDFVPDAGHAPTDAPYHNPGTTSAQVSGHWKNGHTHTHTQTHTHPSTHTHSIVLENHLISFARDGIPLNLKSSTQICASHPWVDICSKKPTEISDMPKEEEILYYTCCP